MAIATRTINPLHFEDLEPHRFEDLVRQLAYDFRNWRCLEATGRQGSDDGFDVRGWEIIAPTDSDLEPIDGSEVEEDPAEVDRLWLIQCKREKTITPQKLLDHLDALNIKGEPPLYGLILVAPCEFSKKTRDACRQWCANNEITEHIIWGKAELEDFLFSPKYDHLLFAYFGISLLIRKRSLQSKLRSMLTTKRKCVRHLGDVTAQSYKLVLLRDPECQVYPYKDKIKDFDLRPLWRVYEFQGHYHSGIKILIKTHFAYIDENGNWDYEERLRSSRHYEDPWAPEQDEDLLSQARNYWMEIPEDKRGTLEVTGFVPYEEIIAIDEHGDSRFPHPHIYVHFDPKCGPFKHAYPNIVTYSPRRESFCIEDNKRIKFFPPVYPVITAHENA